MSNHYAKYDAELLKNDFIKRHYECLPYIGTNYEKTGLLLIAESHYVPQNDVKHVDREDFYDISFDDIVAENKRWFKTRDLFEDRVNNKKWLTNFFVNPPKEIAKIINNTDNPSLDQTVDAMRLYSFINYFKKPSFNTAKSISNSILDNEYAYKVSSAIIDVLKPKLIIFLSKKAYREFCNEDKDEKIRSKYEVKAVAHPTSRWWYKQVKNGKSGREYFLDYVREFLK